MMMLRADNASAGAQATLHDLIGRVRDLSLHLRPSMLDDFGLVAALAWLTRRLQEQSGLHVRLRSRGMQFRLAPAVETAAFRVVQEALTNVVRYAGVAEAEVRLACDGETLRVRVADRGTGFDPAAARPRPAHRRPVRHARARRAAGGPVQDRVAARRRDQSVGVDSARQGTRSRATISRRGPKTNPRTDRGLRGRDICHRFAPHTHQLGDRP